MSMHSANRKDEHTKAASTVNKNKTIHNNAHFSLGAVSKLPAPPAWSKTSSTLRIQQGSSPPPLMQQDSTALESGSSTSSSESAVQSCGPYHPTLPLPNSSPSLPSSPPDPQIATDDAQYSGLQPARTRRPPPPLPLSLPSNLVASEFPIPGDCQGAVCKSVIRKVRRADEGV